MSFLQRVTSSCFGVAFILAATASAAHAADTRVPTGPVAAAAARSPRPVTSDKVYDRLWKDHATHFSTAQEFENGASGAPKAEATRLYARATQEYVQAGRLARRIGDLRSKSGDPLEAFARAVEAISYDSAAKTTAKQAADAPSDQQAALSEKADHMRRLGTRLKRQSKRIEAKSRRTTDAKTP